MSTNKKDSFTRSYVVSMASYCFVVFVFVVVVVVVLAVAAPCLHVFMGVLLACGCRCRRICFCQCRVDIHRTPGRSVMTTISSGTGIHHTTSLFWVCVQTATTVNVPIIPGYVTEFKRETTASGPELIETNTQTPFLFSSMMSVTSLHYNEWNGIIHVLLRVSGWLSYT